MQRQPQVLPVESRDLGGETHKDVMKIDVPTAHSEDLSFGQIGNKATCLSKTVQDGGYYMELFFDGVYENSSIIGIKGNPTTCRACDLMGLRIPWVVASCSMRWSMSMARMNNMRGSGSP
jgi:hypothetical protein